ncbi:hypothetical protein BH24ACT15_BH24ACT15_30430 [soil metagenome]
MSDTSEIAGLDKVDLTPDWRQVAERMAQTVGTLQTQVAMLDTLVNRLAVELAATRAGDDSGELVRPPADDTPSEPVVLPHRDIPAGDRTTRAS